MSAGGGSADDQRAPGARLSLLAVGSLVLAASVLFCRYLFWDTFYDLYAGRYIVHHGIPHSNVVTVASARAPWVDQQWLAHVIFYGAWAAGGYRLLAAVSGLGITAGFAVLALVMLRRGIPALRAFEWTAAAFALCFGSLIIRAESLAYPLAAVTLWLVLDDHGGSRLRGRTWVLIPVLVGWANIHGSVLLGAGLVVAYTLCRAARSAAGRARRQAAGYVVLGLLAAASILCTPYGTAIVADDARFIGNPVLARNIVEWAPQNVHSAVSWIFFAVAAATVLAVAVAWRRGSAPDPLLGTMTVILLILAVTAVRNQVWFGFGGCLLAADSLARSSAGRHPDVSPVLYRALAGLLAALAAGSLVLLAATPATQFFRLTPRQSVDVAASIAARHPRMRVLGDEASGSAMLWLRPAMSGRVGFDWRLDQYTDAELTAYFDFMRAGGPRWQRVLRGYDIVVVSRTEAPALARAMSGLSGWRVVHQDGAGLVLERGSAG